MTDTVMQDLKNYFHRQVPKIAESLQKEIQTLNPVVFPIASHVLNAGGKRLRPVLCLLTAECLGYKDESIYPLASALEMIHSASLLHDDVLDNAVLRRGKTSAHLLFGVRETILAGDALLALANKVVTKYQDVALVSCVSEAIYQTASGEILEIARMNNPTLNMQEYLEIIEGKTGYLIQTCCQAGAIIAQSDLHLQEAARNFGLNLGIAFQMIDDALDYSVSEEKSGKPSGGDLREGKLTLPLIFFLQGLEKEKREYYQNRIKERKLSQQEHSWIVQEIENKKLNSQTRHQAQSYLEKAQKALYQFPLSEQRDLLEQIMEYIKVRKI